MWVAGGCNAVFLGAIGLAFVLLAPFIVGTPVPATAAPAVSCLRTVAADFLFSANGMVLTEAFNGAGETSTARRIVLASGSGRSPSPGIASGLGPGPWGVFLAIAITYGTLAAVRAILFKRGSPKARAV